MSQPSPTSLPTGLLFVILWKSGLSLERLFLVNVHVGETGKTGCTVQSWPSCCHCGKMCKFFKLHKAVASALRFLFSSSAVLPSLIYLFFYLSIFARGVFFLSLLSRTLQLLFWNLIFICRTCVCIWPLELIFQGQHSDTVVLCYWKLSAVRGEFAMFQICPQGAVSAFLDNTPVEGRQVASTFHIFLSGFTSFIISYQRKTVWRNMR